MRGRVAITVVLFVVASACTSGGPAPGGWRGSARFVEGDPPTLVIRFGTDTLTAPFIGTSPFGEGAVAEIPLEVGRCEAVEVER